MGNLEITSIEHNRDLSFMRVQLSPSISSLQVNSGVLMHRDRSACLYLIVLLFWPAGTMSVGREKRYRDTPRERTRVLVALPW